jgi:hypothetical protein
MEHIIRRKLIRKKHEKMFFIMHLTAYFCYTIIFLKLSKFRSIIYKIVVISFSNKMILRSLLIRIREKKKKCSPCRL